MADDELEYFPFYPLKFLHSTAHMTNEAVGAYARILFKGWIDERPVGTFPSDDKTLAELAQADEKEWERIKSSVVRRFNGKTKDGRYIQERLRQTFLNVKRDIRVRREQRSIAGKASAKARAERRATKVNGRSTGVQREVNGKQQIKPNQTKPNKRKPNPSANDVLRTALRWLEVGAVEECAEREKDGLTVADLLRIHDESGGADSRQAAIVTKLRNGFKPAETFSADHVMRWVNEYGIVASVCGTKARSAGVSTNGVLVLNPHEPDEKRIAKNELTASAIAWQFPEMK